jgi:hypothetical protein
MTTTRPFCPASRPLLRGLLLLAVGGLASLGASSAEAAARACPSHGAKIPVTFGVTDDETDAAVLIPEGYVERRFGDARATLRTTTARNGRRVPHLCAGRRLVAVLPSVPRGTRLVGVSANDRMVTWRTARTARSGALHVGRIRGTRVRTLRRTSIVAPGDLHRWDPRIIVNPNGDVAWALDRKDESTVWVWPRRGPVWRVPREKYVSRVDLLRLVDDQHLMIDRGDRLVAFAPPRPGQCPTLTPGRWRALGAWRATTVNGMTIGLDTTDSWQWTLVCDPVSGRVVHVTRSGSESSHYGGSGNDVTRLAKLGTRLLVERRWQSQSLGAYSPDEYATNVVDLDGGRVTTVAGALSGPETPIPKASGWGGPPPGPTPEQAESIRIKRGVAVADGVVAWTESGASGLRVLLDDGAGLRDVGRTSGLDLTLDDALRWDEDGTARAVPVVPDPARPLAVVTLVR